MENLLSRRQHLRTNQLKSVINNLLWIYLFFELDHLRSVDHFWLVI